MKSRKAQRDRLLQALLQAPGHELSLPQIVDMRISQYSARLHELRKLGFRIENHVDMVNGVRHSRFRLLMANQMPAAPTKSIPKPEHPMSETGTLFELGVKGQEHRDDN